MISYSRTRDVRKLQEELFMKTDRRTKYTKMVIRQAFMEAMKSKPFQKITVADICALAEISRPTFYFHYADKFDLLDEIGENMLSSANLTKISELTIERPDEIFKAILNLVKIVEDNMEVYRICVLERGVNSRLPSKITEELNATVISYWEQKGVFADKLDKRYVSDFIQSTFNSVIRCWIEKKDDRESAEKIAEIIKTFALRGFLGFV